MARMYMLDETGVLEQYVSSIIQRSKDFVLLEHLHFLCVWRLGEPEMDSEKRFLQASIRRLPNRERDIYGKDIELRVYEQGWQEKTHRQRLQLIFHELLHVAVRVDESLTPMVDDDGRIKVDIVPHDIVFRGFKREWECFGVSPEVRSVMHDLSQYVRRDE